MLSTDAGRFGASIAATREAVEPGAHSSATKLAGSVPIEVGESKFQSAPKMVAEELHAWFGATEVLKGISLPVLERNVTAIIGPSGCGKSTFIRCLNRLYEVVPGARASGRVLLDGADVYAPRIDPVRLRRRVGMVLRS